MAGNHWRGFSFWRVLCFNRTMPKPSAKLKKLKFSPANTIKALEKRLTTRSALEPQIIQTEDLKRRAMKMHIAGKDHDHIARRLSITPEQAHEYICAKIKQYITSESFDPTEIKEVLARRYDSALALSMYEAFPHPAVDGFGRPIMGNTCKCDLAPGQLCSEEGHIAQIMTPPNLEWLKVHLQVLAEQKKMYGVDAADKLKQKTTDILERTYKGVSSAVIDNL